MIIENHIFLWAMVGAASGTVLGLAGTGGGVIAIPILMAFGGYDIKEASGYGLLALTVGGSHLLVYSTGKIQFILLHVC